jgi:RNA polymerase sigma-70 factor (ECF subfamily)
MGGGEATDDIIQEAFIRLHQLSREDQDRGLLVRIASNLLRDRWRSQTRRDRPAYKATLGVHAPASTNADQFEYVLLRDIVRSLSPLQREVFVLHRFGGKTYAEIAAILGISVKAVERRMSEALAHCTEALRD